MSRGKKTGGKDWTPGEQPKSPGRPELPREFKKARRLTRTAFEGICNRFVHMTGPELRKAKYEPQRTQLERIVIAVLEKAEGWGDTSRLNFVLDRLIGKVPDEIKHSGAIDTESARQREEARLIASDPEALALAKALQDRVNAKRQ